MLRSVLGGHVSDVALDAPVLGDGRASCPRRDAAERFADGAEADDEQEVLSEERGDHVEGDAHVVDAVGEESPRLDILAEVGGAEGAEEQTADHGGAIAKNPSDGRAERSHIGATHAHALEDGLGTHDSPEVAADVLCRVPDLIGEVFGRNAVRVARGQQCGPQSRQETRQDLPLLPCERDVPCADERVADLDDARWAGLARGELRQQQSPQPRARASLRPSDSSHQRDCQR